MSNAQVAPPLLEKEGKKNSKEEPSFVETFVKLTSTYGKLRESLMSFL
jgi:hypothetical protein